MFEILKSPNRNQNESSAFFVGVPLFSFLLEIFSRLLTLHCLKCLFHMNNHIDKVVNVMFVEKVSIWNVTSENISKKSTWLFWVPSWKYQYFWQLLQNQKVPKNVMAISNHAKRFTGSNYLDVDNTSPFPASRFPLYTTFKSGIDFAY